MPSNGIDTGLCPLKTYSVVARHNITSAGDMQTGKISDGASLPLSSTHCNAACRLSDCTL
jgi:hypothetical protein